MNALVDILGSPDEFLDYIFDQLKAINVDVDSLPMDHICYRVETMNDYVQVQVQLLQYGRLLSGKMIAGRPISVIQLDVPYSYRNRSIDVIELPAPKSTKAYSAGYEHVEFVVDADLELFMAKYPKVNFDLSGMRKAINRDIKISWNLGTAKFHKHSLKYVIEVLEN